MLIEKKTVIKVSHQCSQQPIVSVCITAFNHSQFIDQCLESVLMQQTNFDFEICLGEDHSNDNTREICQAYAHKHPDKIRLFLHNRENVIFVDGKPTGRFNFLYNLQNARGKYIALLDGDDYWTDPLKLQKQVDILDNNSACGICFHAIEAVKNGLVTRNTSTEPLFKNGNTTFTRAELLREGNFIATLSVMIRKAFLPDEMPDVFNKFTVGDFGLYLLALNKQDFNLIYLSDCMAHYRIHTGGIHSLKNKNKIYLNAINDLKLFDAFSKSKFQNEISINIESKKYLLLMQYYLENDDIAAKTLIKKEPLKNNVFIMHKKYGLKWIIKFFLAKYFSFSRNYFKK